MYNSKLQQRYLPQRRALRVHTGVSAGGYESTCVRTHIHTQRSYCIRRAAVPKVYVQLILCCLWDSAIGHCAGFRKANGHSTLLCIRPEGPWSMRIPPGPSLQVLIEDPKVVLADGFGSRCSEPPHSFSL